MNRYLNCVLFVGALFVASTQSHAAPIRDYAEFIRLDGSGLLVRAGEAPGEFIVNTPDFRQLSFCEFPHGETCGVGQMTRVDKDLQQLRVLSAHWNVIFHRAPAKGALRIATSDPGGKDVIVPLSITEFDWKPVRSVLELHVKLASTLSAQLAVWRPQWAANAVKIMPKGYFTGAFSLVVDNDRHIPHDLTSTALKYRLYRKAPLVKCEDVNGGIWFGPDCGLTRPDVFMCEDRNGNRSYGHDCVRLTRESLQRRLSPVASLAAATPETQPNNPLATAPACDSAQTAQNLVTYTKSRSDLVGLTDPGGQSLDLESGLATKIAKASTLNCDWKVDTSIVNDAGNPANVRTIMGIMDIYKWNDLTSQMVKGEPADSVDAASFSYESFLKAAGRFPFFCGEKGIYASEREACIRELSAFFAHSNQETGANDPNLTDAGGKPLPTWKQAFARTREGSCYLADISVPGNPNAPTKCTNYDAPFPNIPDLKQDTNVHYYGRGFFQISYPYNYAGFSAQFLGDEEALLKDPDYVGRNGYAAFASALWFYMTPQPPKPSMHDIIVGGSLDTGYNPQASALGIEVEPVTLDGKSGNVIKNRFMASIAAINGSVECSPADGLNPQGCYLYNDETQFVPCDINNTKVLSSHDQAIYTTTRATLIQNDTVQAANRIANYAQLLTYFGAVKDSIEASYPLVVDKVNPQGCDIANSNPRPPGGSVFTNSDLIFNPPWYIGKDPQANCQAFPWFVDPPYMINSEKSVTLGCK
ncbi:chitinase [Methylolobus aquaticus]